MNKVGISARTKGARVSLAKALLAGSALAAVASPAYAQDNEVNETVDADEDVIIVSGIRSSLASALNEKREADSLIEVIKAEDIGKLPDQNLAEVLENITGVQITRENGVGTGVQIRGTDSNRLEINGVTTVGAGNGRGGINFEDLNPSIIAGVEVIKAPEAKHIEGSVGGTVNLKTIRPLDLSETLISLRGQLEDSSLSSDGLKPRISGAIGKKWETSDGREFGFVLSGSYTESANTAFRPRLDRDNLTDCTGATPPTSCPAGAPGFLGVQFLNQVQETQNFETINIAASVEGQVTDNLKLYADYIYTDQTRRLSGSRVQFSNVSRLNGASDRTNGGNINFTDFATFNLGRDAIGQDLGSILAVTAGTFTPQQRSDFATDADFRNARGAPFMRVSSDNGSRLTTSDVFIAGAEWESDRLSIAAEFSRVSADTVNPNLSSTLNFINPNSDIAPNNDAGTSFRDENGIPIIFDLRDGISFGINFADPFAPTAAQLLDGSNYVLDGTPTYSANIQENEENAFRFDASYDFTDAIGFISSVDAGYRYSNRTTLRDNRQASRSGSSSLAGSLNAGGISDLLAEIPNNFGDGTGSDLFVSGVLHLDPNNGANPEDTVAAINAAAAAQGLGPIFTSELTSIAGDFFDIEEETHAIYGQVNFETEDRRFRGNAGLRWVDTSISSTANVLGAGDPTLNTIESGYSHFLPRVNLAFDVTDDITLRASYSQEINRPGFVNISSALELPDAGQVNSNAEAGNPDLRPEEITSFDVSASWYFAPEAVFSIGYFRKERDGLFGVNVDEPGGPGDPGVIAPNTRDTVGPICEGGGIFSPLTEAGIFGNGETGVCVGLEAPFNSNGTTTQQGIEVAFQYNLSDWEDRLGSFGFLSGLGIVANYTYQTESNNSGFTDIAGSRAQAIFAGQGFDPDVNPVQRETATLLNLSKHAYNVTAFYEKYGISARVRYTWRDTFRTDDLPGTGNVFEPLGFRGAVESRGQLNASVNYAITDQINVGVEGTNLTKSSQNISCVNDGALLCYEGITDRRIQFGVSFTY
ncbi:TonB-dependent receptor [Parasphingorhabdus litoris]|uniref:TonB-dependent receptor n=1 Tax=Parasphingorhabdus litoris TaxID=394733 RepID=A0ABN1A153_9SPHN|nr:TonB-dependent receptor [Parasphingorhabdus litoris]